MDIVGIIPVKGNSERVKKKNIRKFANTNLFELKLSQLKKTKNFKKFVVSSENQKILDIAKRKGFSTHHRDPFYSTSKVSMSKVYSYIASNVEGEHVAWINVTNPLVSHKIYDQAASIYKKIYKRYNCLLSAVENRENFFYRKKPINFKPQPWPRSQDLEPLISLPFVINILKRKNLIKWGSCVGNNPYFYKLDPVISTDIDQKHNFDFCEMIYKQKKNDLKSKKK